MSILDDNNYRDDELENLDNFRELLSGVVKTMVNDLKGSGDGDPHISFLANLLTGGYQITSNVCPYIYHFSIPYKAVGLTQGEIHVEYKNGTTDENWTSAVENIGISFANIQPNNRASFHSLSQALRTDHPFIAATHLLNFATQNAYVP